MAKTPSGQKRRLKVAMIGGSDLVTQLERDFSVDVSLRGINDFARHLDPLPLQWDRIHITPNYFRQTWRWDFRTYHIACNLVTDGDRNPKTLKVAQRMAEKIDLPMINHPARIPRTSRDTLPGVIGDIPGVIIPRTIRLRNATPERLKSLTAQDSLSWPLLVREPGRHNGEFVGLFASPAELAPHLTGTSKDYFLTEFVDFASPDGLYRKYRFFFIGNSILLRHLIIGESWNLHGRDKLGLNLERADLLREDERTLGDQLDAFPQRTADILREIKARIGLDYFGIDCNVTPAGDVLVFEANATMNYFPYAEEPEFHYIRETLEGITKVAVKRLLEDTLGQSQTRRLSAERAPPTTAADPPHAGEPQNA